MYLLDYDHTVIQTLEDVYDVFVFTMMDYGMVSMIADRTARHVIELY